MRGPSPWTTKRDAQLTADWAAGFTTAEIGARMGISKNSVIGRAHQLMLASRADAPRAHPWTEADNATLRQLYGGFMTAAEIAARMGRSVWQISYRAKFLGLVAGRRAKQTGAGAAFTRSSAGRDAFSFPGQSRPVTFSGVTSSAVERRASSLLVENLPGAVAETPPRRVFSHKQCQYISGKDRRDYRFCEAPVVENAMGRPSAFCATHFDLCLVSPKKALEERKAQRLADIEAARVRWNPPSAWR